jgi:hypothetical protein
MPFDASALNQSISDLTAEVTTTETVDAGVAALLQGQAAAITTAVTAALTADAAANQGSITAASQAIAQVTARFVAARAPFATAVIAGTPSA